jgi:hypothetical protein
MQKHNPYCSEQYGRWQDKVAWMGLAKLTNAHYPMLKENDW